MITRIKVNNFKGLKDIEINLKSVNILIGENGTGKSSIMDVLSVLKRSSDSPGQIILELLYTNLGTPTDILGDARECSISIEGSTLHDTGKNLFGVVDISYSCAVVFDISGIVSYNTVINIPNGPKISNGFHRFGGARVDPSQIVFGKGRFNLSPAGQVGLAWQNQGYTYETQLVEEQRVVNETYMHISNLSQLIKTTLHNVFIIPVVRGIVSPYHNLMNSSPEEVIVSGSLLEMGSSLASKLEYNKRLLQKISEFAERITGVRVDVDVLSGPRLAIKNPLKGTNMVNEGFGSNQLLFILERLLFAKPGSLIGIEEPEIHLHPKAQWDLADIICEKSKADKHQIIMTTHSEHIIYPILNKIAKNEDLHPDDVAIFNFEINKENGIITISEKKIDDKGRVEGGLRGFIEANLRAFDEYIKS